MNISPPSYKSKLTPLALVTGGGGFIGFNIVKDLLEDGWRVRVLDNLSRYGADNNVKILQTKFPNSFEFVKADIRESQEVEKAASGVDIVYHLAAQVAVTTSVSNPRADFEINATGTFNVLEAARLQKQHPIIIYTSTNKVYGGMEEIGIEESNGRYCYSDNDSGISESRSLDFHSPYGCSKGAADQYIHDYSRIYNIPTLVFRNSCIYGPPQMGNEDQGWIAHFIISACLNKPITIYGDGKQVRDVLYISDLVECYKKALNEINKTSGQIFNIGGGPNNTLSLLDLISIIETRIGREIKPSFQDWRPGDQRVYISDIQKSKNTFDWQPSVSTIKGVNKLIDWVQNSLQDFQNMQI
tara:strand:+ start:1238 stop:2305 length:1068 start_codon:yes stop_codon:yes gene_type:complete